MFRGARLSDLDEIMQIYARARQVMAENGNPTQWGDSYPSRELVEHDICTNRLFVYMVHGKMMAVFTLMLREDPTYAEIEGEWLNDAPYGVMHRLASAGSCPGMGKAVLEWCAQRCGNLRADTHEDNKIMQHVLEKNGFVRCGIIHVEDGTPRIAYQRAAVQKIG